MLVFGRQRLGSDGVVLRAMDFVFDRQKGRFAVADRERVRVSFWTRYRDYLENTQATSNVPMLARLALPSTQSAHIVNDQIKLAGGGWGGTFIGH